MTSKQTHYIILPGIVVHQPAVQQDLPSCPYWKRNNINFSPVIWDLPQSIQSFKDDRKQPDYVISHLSQYPQEASCLDAWTCMGQDFLEDPWLNFLPLTPSLSEPHLWGLGVLIHEDQDQEVMEYLSLLWLNHHLPHLAPDLHFSWFIAFSPHTPPASYLCLLNTLLLQASFTSTHFPPRCLNLLTELPLLPSKPC